MHVGKQQQHTKDFNKIKARTLTLKGFNPIPLKMFFDHPFQLNKTIIKK